MRAQNRQYPFMFQKIGHFSNLSEHRLNFDFMDLNSYYWRYSLPLSLVHDSLLVASCELKIRKPNNRTLEGQAHHASFTHAAYWSVANMALWRYLGDRIWIRYKDV
jgi:hypothetical protein